MGAPAGFRGPLKREGAKIDSWARKRYGISGEALLTKLGQGESGFNRGAVSNKNAKGAFQFIPGTRNAILNETGADAYGSPAEATRAARIYVRRHGLEGYNPGDPSYPSYILGQKVGHGGGSAGGGGSQTTYTPGASHADERRQAVVDWYRSRHGHGKPESALDLVTSLHDLADEPGKLKTTGGDSGGSRGGSIKSIGELAQSEGLHVGENPHFGGVNPVHVKTSWHYKGRAIDVSGSPAKMRRFAREVYRTYGSQLKELFWNGSGAVNVKNGKRVGKGFVEGHTDHVHVAL